MTKPTRILIADDQEIVPEGLAVLLADAPELAVLDEKADDGLSAVRLAMQLIPDVVLMDLYMPSMSGTDAARDIKKRRPEIKVLMLTSADSERHVKDAMEAKADGFLNKDTSKAELLRAIEAVMAGDTYFIEGTPQSGATGSLDKLTRRERQILKLVAEGNKNREIADMLHISVKTVETHRLNLMRKLGLRSAAQLTAFAHREGVV
jgi:DNA-binding NarL/FixJ family response regulator